MLTYQGACGTVCALCARRTYRACVRAQMRACAKKFIPG